MKPKMNESGGIAADENGNPIFVHEDGKEEGLNVEEVLERVKKESISRKTKLKEVSEENAAIKEKYKLIEDPEIALDAMRKVEGFDSQNLIDAETAANEKEKILSQSTLNLENVTNKFTGQLKERDEKILELEQKAHRDNMLQKFANCESLKGTVFEGKAVMALTFLGGNFKEDENGSVKGFLGNEKISSEEPKNIGKDADFNEAVKIIVKNLPNSDSYYLAGSGGRGTEGPGNPGKELGLKDVKNMSQAEYTKYRKNLKLR